jgi:hypothetical protein
MGCPDAILHALQFRQGLVLPYGLGHSAALDELHEGVDDNFPEALVLGVQKYHQPRGLGVEGAGDVLNGCVDDLFDLGVGNWAVLAEFVDCAAGFGQLDERVCVGHLGRCRLGLRRSEGSMYS